MSKFPDAVLEVGWGEDLSESPLGVFGVEQGGPLLGWSDHARIEMQDDRIIFSSHPYYISEEDVDQLAILRLSGWNVYINGHSSYDEHAMQIVFYKEES